jgi:hypothetical protein
MKSQSMVDLCRLFFANQIDIEPFSMKMAEPEDARLIF